MKNKRSILILFIIFVTLFLVGLSFLYPEKFNFCSVGDRDCIYPNAFKIGEPLVFTTPVMILLSVILFFTKPEVFKMWSKFALVAIPLLALWIINTPVQCDGGYISMCFDKESASLFSAVGFLIISLMIIIYQSFKLRTKNILTN